jgi:flagellar basal-body rod modification protein FlgD
MSSTVGSATQQKLDFMTLLVTELQNQNPLEPMDHQQMASQLAQFSQLELTENMTGNMSTMTKTMETMNNSFQGAMLMAQMDYAKSLLGKQITFYDPSSGTEMLGQVKKVTFQNGLPVLNTDVSIAGSGSTETFKVGLAYLTGIEM